jgi:hypothetical protein
MNLCGTCLILYRDHKKITFAYFEVTDYFKVFCIFFKILPYNECVQKEIVICWTEENVMLPAYRFSTFYTGGV